MARKLSSVSTAAGKPPMPLIHTFFEAPPRTKRLTTDPLTRDRNGSVGYKVSKVDFAHGSPLKTPAQSKSALTDIMSNVDVSKCGQIVPYVWNKDCFRPAGLAFDKKGRLFMSSDETGEIWAITKVAGGKV